MKAYHDWIVGQALPFWSTRGFDSTRGRFAERLNLQGSPLDVPHRVMLQARQIYVFAHAAELGWFTDGGSLAERAMDNVLRTYCTRSGGEARFAFSADADGGIVTEEQDAYAHAFMLFALAALHRLNGDSGLLAIADETIAFIEHNLADPVHGGLYDSYPVKARDKRQNPLMHLFEAYLFLDQAAPGRGYLDRAGGVLRLFRERLFRPEPGVLLEYFAEDWSRHADAAKAAVFEPGHHFEWVWLLGEYARLSGEPPLPAADILFTVARERGIAATGLIWDELDTAFRVTKAAHRVWPHTEAIKAAVARSLAGDAGAAAMAESMAAALLRTFLDKPFAGGWIDHVDATGAPLTDVVPASSLYHLFLADVEAQRLAPSPAPILR